MNIVDIVVLAIIALSLLFGLYRGFVSSLCGLLSVFIAMYAAYALCPTVTNAIRQNETLVNTLSYYTDATSRLGDLDVALSNVDTLNDQQVDAIVNRIDLPAPFDSLLKYNLVNRAFQALGNLNVSEYLNQTILSVVLNILCYIALFGVAYLALTLLTQLIGFVFQFPVLRQLDALVGGALGLVRGVFLVIILFALVPVAMTVAPLDGVQTLINESQFGQWLYHSDMIQTILQGHL